MLNLDRLLLLQELQRRGSVIAVATALSYSPSTVSQQLKVLEREVGTILTERVGRGIRLTRAGEKLVEGAVRIFTEIERTQAAVASVVAEPTGDVRVAALQTTSLALLPKTIEFVERENPHPRIFVSRIEPKRSLGALSAREFDVVIGEEYPGFPLGAHPGITRRVLLRDPLIMVAPPGRVINNSPSATGDAHSWVMEPLGSDARSWAVGMCASLGIDPQLRFESDDLLVQLRLVETGHAVAMMPRLLLASEQPKLDRLELPGNPTRNLFVAYREGSEHIPAIDVVVKGLAHTAQFFAS